MHIVIIGNGISGITAARFIRKLSDHRITVISDETAFFFSRTALMYIYMGHMKFEHTQPYEKWFWTKNRIDLRKGRVRAVDTFQKRLVFKDGQDLSFDKLIIATGSAPRYGNWPGTDLEGVQGLYHLQDLENMERLSKGLQRAVIVGGGLIGIEMAEMFHSRNIPVTLLVRESSYWGKVLPPEESEMINREILAHGVDLRLETELVEILDDGTGKVGGILTNTTAQIDCGFVGLTIGVQPNIDFLKNTDIEINRGILVDNHLKTNLADIYAIGDCAEIRTPQSGRRPIEAVWYTGRMMGEVAAYNVCDKPVAYLPGIWFNSAKFFNVEYQVYGQVPVTFTGQHRSVFWQSSDDKKSIRIVYDANTNAVVGFNLMGVRYRQEVCEGWIREGASIQKVLDNLEAANFDGEFFKQYEQEVKRQFITS